MVNAATPVGGVINSLVNTTASAEQIARLEQGLLDGSTLGANCHFKNSYVPVGVITDLDGNILVGNAIQTDSDVIINPYLLTQSSTKISWLLTGARTLVTRFWSASTASAVLVPAVGLGELSPPLPDTLSFEREICIWLGYIDAVRPVTQQDLINGSLLRVFIGVIDNRQFTGTASGGETVQLQCRCRMKWLMDSTVYYNPKELESLSPAGSKDIIRRSSLVLEIARRSIGEVKGNGCIDCGKKILENQQYIIDIEDDAVVEADTWYTANGPLVGATKTELKVNKNPEFRIFSTRAAIKTQESQNFLINQQTPVEILKYLAMQEVYPTEVFQDSRDGNFYYGPRANDASGLIDSKRLFRSYYYKIAPLNANINQSLISFREEQSSIGLKTNFLIDKSAVLGQGAAHDDWMLHLRTRPYGLKGIDFACKFQRINDPTIKNLSEAAGVALAAARIMGREVRVAMAVVLGDPSFVPGEIIQVQGSGLLPNGGKDRAAADRQQFLQYNNRYRENIKTYAEMAYKGTNEDQVTLPIYDGSTATFKKSAPDNQNISSLICDISSQVVGSNGIGFNEEPATIYRVEAVLHKFNISQKGMTTELALSTPF